MVGSTHFIDAIVQVPRTFPIDRVDEIKRKAQAAVVAAFEDADLTFTAVPVARDNESVRERIMVIARNSGLAVHHVTVHDLGDKLTVSIDLEVDGEMTLIAAHDIAHELERNIRDDFGEDVEVDTHIEPLEPELPQGTDAAPDRLEVIRAALSQFAAPGAIHDIHNVRVRDTNAGEIVNFHCRAAPSMSVIKVHESVDEIERALASRIPEREARHQSRRAAEGLSESLHNLTRSCFGLDLGRLFARLFRDLIRRGQEFYALTNR